MSAELDRDELLAVIESQRWEISELKVLVSSLQVGRNGMELSRRDAFAMAAMQAMLPGDARLDYEGRISRWAYSMADAMIRQSAMPISTDICGSESK